MDVNTNTAALDASNTDLDLMLADLDIQDGDIQEIEAITDAEDEIKEEPVEELPEVEIEAAPETPVTQETEVSEELADEIGAAIEVEEQRDAIYAEQPADATELDAAAAATSAAAAPAKKARAASTGTGRVRQGLNDLAEGAFVLTTDVPADLAANKAAVIASCPAQKKVQEKFENLLVSVANSRLPSTYTQICFRALMAAPGGEITGVELTGALKASGLGEGTARSQSGQLMALFPAVKIATRSGNKLKVNPDSMLVEALKALMSL